MIDRILIVGLGSIGKRHLKYCREIFPKADIKIFRHTKSDEVPELSNGCLFKYDDVIIPVTYCKENDEISEEGYKYQKFFI